MTLMFTDRPPPLLVFSPVPWKRFNGKCGTAKWQRPMPGISQVSKSYNECFMAAGL